MFVYVQRLVAGIPHPKIFAFAVQMVPPPLEAGD